jgi:hypothetical protein
LASLPKISSSATQVFACLRPLRSSFTHVDRGCSENTRPVLPTALLHRC